MRQRQKKQSVRLFLMRVLETLKRKLLKVFLLDALFLIFLFLFLSYIRRQLEQYVTFFQQLAPQLGLMQEGNPEQLNALVSLVDPVVQKATILLAVVLPLGIFALYVFFQGASWNVLRRKAHPLELKSLLLFGLVSLPVFVLLMVLIRIFLFRVNLSLQGYALNLAQVFSPLFLVGLAVLLLGLYFTFAVYSQESLWGAVKGGLRKAYLFAPLFVLGLVFLFMASVFFFQLFVLYAAGFLDLSSWSLALWLAVFTLLLGVVKSVAVHMAD